ncbi:MAG: hypothetical protein K0R82_1576 [Flavipsychrobacter sp.]|jgi:hypothetical protein|nr:hypothetical protein [Flavipsychrobacter sp.]
MKPATTGENRVYTILFWLLVAISVLLPWMYTNFLTTDGPCHVYNASVLRQFWNGNTAFYDRFYTLNTDLHPNWLSHIVLAVLMYVFNPFTAEKILISLCLLLLAGGFRYFILGFSARQHYLALWVIPFLWQMAMFMGFYNYMLSIGCMFWISGYWLRYRDTVTWKQVLLCSLASVVLYFMHLLGIFLCIAVMGLVSLSDILRHKGFRPVLAQLSKLVVLFVPAGLLALNYVKRSGGGFSNEWKQPLDVLWGNLRTIFSMQSIAAPEYDYTRLMALSIALLLAFAIVLTIIRRRGYDWIMPAVMLAVMLLSYFFAYESMLGGSYIRPRLECLVYLFAVVFVATVPAPKAVRIVSVLVAAGITCMYLSVRIPMFRHVNVFVSEVKSLEPYIKDQTVIMPLRYENFPKNANGEVMANKVLLFSHVIQSIPQNGKRYIFMDNYEAIVGYFPFLWKKEINPDKHLSIGGGLEGTPPEVALTRYNRENALIQHIVVWGKQGDIANHPRTLELADTINKYYELVYTTPVYKIELYNLKGLK